ncbi:uvsH [Symbiodinium natans]|uniref:UvsH protein n=1 Tax=Symbiodinium natans TaxID=878477 RepID=A0A812NL47_9DINO|nr:uvsH [Symbiodinium natans]
MTGTAPREMKEEADPKKAPQGGPEDGKKKSFKRYVLLGVGAVLALVAAYVYKKGGKEELMSITRETLLSLQSLRDYGAFGYVAFILAFVTMLTLCLPGTMAWCPVM